MRKAILTSPGQWFEDYAAELAQELKAELLTAHEQLHANIDCLFILSYHRLVPQDLLARQRFNPVVHASALPQGRGWAPLFWQVLAGQNRIPFTLFEARAGADTGPIYLQRELELSGYELNAELRHRQAQMVLAMCREFAEAPEAYLPARAQQGEPSEFPKRGPADSELDPDRSLREQFNLLRIVDNEAYPAFFEIDGHRYRLKIEAMDED